LQQKVNSLSGQLNDLTTVELLGAERTFRLVRRLVNFRPSKIADAPLCGARHLDWQVCGSELEAHRGYRSVIYSRLPNMDRMIRRFCLIPVALVFSSVCFSQTPDLFYKPRGERGNYSEGIRANLSTEPNILLIGAMVDHVEVPYRDMPDNFEVLFYLPRSTSVTLTVRETDPRYAYWLQTNDKAIWRPQRTNLFPWHTDDVIKFLNYKSAPLSLTDLAAVVRLGGTAPSEDEHVAPVALFYSGSPTKVDGYKFAFSAEAQATLKFSIYSENTGALIGQEQIFDVDAKKSKWVRCSASSWAEGGYRLTITGKWKANNQPINPHTIHFYHMASLGSR
jgi:hypothetical protein